MDEKLIEIIEKAKDLFLQYGIRSVSMDDICRNLGMSKKTLYNYVSNKQEIIEKIMEDDFLSSMKLMDETISPDCNAIDVLLSVSKIVNNNMKKLNPSTRFDLQKYYPTLFSDFLQKQREHVFIKLKQNMEKGIQEGFYRDDIDVELLAQLYVRKLEDLHDPDFFMSQECSFAKIFEVMFENHIRGISNEKGIAYFESKKQDLTFNETDN